jgi:hypothetical protein
LAEVPQEAEASVVALAAEDSQAEAQAEAGNSYLKDIKKAPNLGLFLFYFSLI